MQFSVLPVALGTTWLALAADAVQEILGTQRVIAVPGGPLGLTGVVPWRGRAIAVLDLAALLPHATALTDDGRARIVIAGAGRDVIALPVDQVREARVADAIGAAHVTSVPRMTREVRLGDETLAVFDVVAWLDALARDAA